MASNIRTILVVFKTHLDLGFTDFAARVYGRYMQDYIPRAIDTALQLRQEGLAEGFVWTTGSYLIDQYLSQATGEALQKAEHALACGDLAWHALPFTTHSELCSPAIFDRGLAISQRLDKRFGKTTIAAKMTDVPGHTRGIIPRLTAAGVEFLHIGVNPACKIPQTPPLFNWQAPDGQCISVMVQRDYGDFVELGNGVAFNLAFTGDNCGPPTASAIRQVYADLHEKYPEAVIRAATLNEVAAAVRSIRHTLPTVTEEIGDSWIHGVGTDPQKLSQYRCLLRLAETWPQAIADSLYDDLLPVAEHTWGLDEKTHLNDHGHFDAEGFKAARGLPNYQKMQASWQEQRDYIAHAVDNLPQAQRIQAQAAIAAYRRVSAVDTGSPALQPADPEQTYTVGHYQLRFSPNGGLAWLAANGVPLADADHPFGLPGYEVFGQADYDRFFDQYLRARPDWAIEDLSKVGIAAAIDTHYTAAFRLEGLWQGGNRFVAVYSAGAEASTHFGCPKSFEMEWRFEPEAIYLDACWLNKPACRLPEAFWLSFCPPADGLRLSKLGCWVDPTRVVVDGNRHLHAVDARGVAYDACSIIPLDCALVAPGRRSLLDFNNILPPSNGGAHFLLYNNVWGTNFPMWYDQDARFRFIIRPACK